MKGLFLSAEDGADSPAQASGNVDGVWGHVRFTLHGCINVKACERHDLTSSFVMRETPQAMSPKVVHLIHRFRRGGAENSSRRAADCAKAASLSCQNTTTPQFRLAE